MAKFCGKCGTKLDETTGLCPKCEAEKLVEASENSTNEKKKETNNTVFESTIGIKDVEKGEKKKTTKKAKKKEKRTDSSLGKKEHHFFLKMILVLIILALLFVSVVTALSYYEIINVPALTDIFELIGIKSPISDSTDEFKILDGKFTDVLIIDDESAIKAAQEGARALGIEDAAEELSIDSINETDDLVYYRLQQNYKGYPVYGKSFVLVTDSDGNASNLSSNSFAIVDVEINVNVTQEDINASIEEYVENMVGASAFDYFEIESVSDDNLCIYTLEDQTARMAFRLYVNTEYGYFVMFVDSITADVLFCTEDTMFVQKEFTYNGQTDVHKFIAEASPDFNAMYYVSDSGTTISIFTPAVGHTYDWYYDGNADIVTWSNENNPDPSAVDAIYNICQAYNYYQGEFHRNSFSGQGEDINVYIHTKGFKNWGGKDVNKVNNAYFWSSPNGPILSITSRYNDKNEEINDYSCELDVIGHEFTHGVVRYTCCLTDTSDNVMPGAINEAIADIMGYCIEATVSSCDIDWTSSARTSIREKNTNMQNIYHFDDYAGDYKKEHSASTIISYAAYLMNSSGVGTLDDKEIAKLWYHTLLTLPSNCTFKVLREHVEMASKNLKFTQEQRTTISNAFEAVGITLVDNDVIQYNPKIELTVYGVDSAPYDDYEIEISGTYNTGWFGWSWFGWFTKEYNTSIAVDSLEPQAVTLKPNGEYNITVIDNKDNSNVYSKNIRVKKSYSNSQIVFTTDFGQISNEKEDEAKNDTSFTLENLPDGAVEYNGHYYYLYTGGIASTYDEAVQYCNGKGGYLATLTSQEENDFVYSYISQQGCESAYFGLSDSVNEGHWEWCTGEPLNYTNWHGGEPNSENSKEDYALFYYKYSDGTWNDGNFDGHTVNGGSAFICEWGDYSSELTQISDGEKPSDERNIILTLDISGSMSGTPMEETKKASTNFINTVLEQDASIGIVTYDNMSNIASEFSADRASLQSIVSELYDGGGTNIEAGLRDAQWMLEKTNSKKKIIVLMSDGEPNDGLVDEDLITYANEIKKSGTIIYTIGFFESLSERSYAQYLMESIASDGCHYEVANANELAFFFEDMADQINGQKYIYVRIACPVDVAVTFDGETLDSSKKNLNLRTSFGTLTFEENREEMTYGLDDRVKVLRLKEGVDYDLKLTGTGHGIMNYTIGFMDENGDYSDLRKFENIKITRRTRIDTVAANSDDSILNIDEDGDGKYDIKLRAEANGYGEEVVTSDWIIYVVIGAVVFIMLDIVAIVIYTKRKKKGK